MQDVICNRCGNQFSPVEADIYTVAEAGYIVQAFDCPSCGESYPILTTDAKMRSLIEKRKALQQAIKTAHIKKFSRKTIRQYERTLEKIKRKQVQMLPSLKKVGNRILSESKKRDEGWLYDK